MSTAIAVLALIVSVVGAWYAKKSADSSKVSAEAAKDSAGAARQSAAVDLAEDHRARTPDIQIKVERKTSYPGTSAIFVVRNDGPQDLDSVVVHRPRPADGITYGIAVTGATDFQDEADLGQLAMAQEARFTLSYGSAPKLPEFRVRIVCRLGDEEWHLTQLLEEGREESPPMVFSA
jgi:hypothetical protein